MLIIIQCCRQRPMSDIGQELESLLSHSSKYLASGGAANPPLRNDIPTLLAELQSLREHLEKETFRRKVRNGRKCYKFNCSLI